MKHSTKPVATQKDGANDNTITYEHPAFGMIGISRVSGGAQVLHGSDLLHNQHIRISISRGTLNRSLSNDWYHATEPVVELGLSHTQFAELITNLNNGDGIPCTLINAPVAGTPCPSMPSIFKFDSKTDILRDEIKSSAKQQMAKIEQAFDRLEKLVESGSVNKKALKEALFAMKCHIDNTPSNLEFVVGQAEETLDKIVSAAKTEVEAYIGNAINKLGLEAAKNLGLTSSTTTGFLTSDVVVEG